MGQRLQSKAIIPTRARMIATSNLVEGQVLTPEDGAPPEDGDPQHEDVDHRQLAQPRPHDRLGLRDRVPRGLAARSPPWE